MEKHSAWFLAHGKGTKLSAETFENAGWQHIPGSWAVRPLSARCGHLSALSSSGFLSFLLGYELFPSLSLTWPRAQQVSVEWLEAARPGGSCAHLVGGAHREPLRPTSVQQLVAAWWPSGGVILAAKNAGAKEISRAPQPRNPREAPEFKVTYARDSGALLAFGNVRLVGVARVP